ncbi:endolytic transglycosylase MltG [Motilibacter aurantiacus]|uniref:endolytic transglycosylase MltG n=1 Tax=Motilibacter aurantiacus TaxID=2714955 RepID=UPI00140AF04B|nr:endolytic transglycosylase MltG [Motilibacter aurantiacus]NHC46042.1 endolytic transglycosylase MltG [Motilibacter aurantiacus]
MSGTRAAGRRRRESRSSAIAVIVSLVVVLGLLGAGFLGVRALVDGVDLAGSTSEDYTGTGTDTVLVEVRKGDTSSAIGRTLKAEGVIKTVGAFVDAATANEESKGIQPGFYNLRKEMAAAEALTLMLDPSSRAEKKVTIPEGLRVTEILPLLVKGTGIPRKQFNAALKSPKLKLPDYAEGNPEGLLFPATYTVAPDATALSVLQQMVNRYESAVEELDTADARLDVYDLVKIASMLEKEVNNEADYGKASRVVYNRLEARESLGFDSTLHYFYNDGEALTTERLAVDSPYNTRKYQGLPPTPISNPGMATLEAAVNPTPGDWRWFLTISLETGETRFYDNYDDFVADRIKYDIDY